MCLLAHFEAIHSILAVANLLAHNNLWSNVQVKTFGGTIYFALDDTQHSKILIPLFFQGCRVI